MALGPRLDLRQSQSLVMTPQLQQAIRLLAASNLEIETFVAEALEENPLLEAGEVRREDSNSDGPEEKAPSETASDTAQGDEAHSTSTPTPSTGTATRATANGAAPVQHRQLMTRPHSKNGRSANLSLADHLLEQVGSIAANPP